MPWYHYVSYFFGGAFLANALPHIGTHLRPPVSKPIRKAAR